MNNIPRDTINPPTTAVSRVDLFLQNNITAGEIARDTQKDVAAKHPKNEHHNTMHMISTKKFLELVMEQKQISK